MHIHSHAHTPTHPHIYGGLKDNLEGKIRNSKCTEPAMIDGCCFYYFVRNSLVALLEARCANIQNLYILFPLVLVLLWGGYD